LLPAEDRDVLTAVSQYRIMGPETNWEAYLAAQQEESERRQAAEAKRMEEFNRVIAEQNARESRGQQLYQQRDALGEDELEGSWLSRISTYVSILGAVRSYILKTHFVTILYERFLFLRRMRR